jgi:hypothetical protein
MNIRDFQTQAILQVHQQLLDVWLNIPDQEPLTVDIADTIAQNAGMIASRLTIRWENDMIWCQNNDDNPSPDANREHTTTSLTQQFVSRQEEEGETWKGTK